MVLCPFFALTGLHCPACGGLRMVAALAHGDIAAAWGQNPLLMVGLGLGLAAVVLLGTRARRMVRAALASRALPWLVLGVALGFAVLRNLPGVSGLGPL